MYIIISKTEPTAVIKGNFPMSYLEDRLKNGDDLIVISTYSDTIKIPFWNDDNEEWDYKEYSYKYAKADLLQSLITQKR